MAKGYRNDQERVYLKILRPLQGLHKFAMEQLEQAEERYSKVRGSKSEANALTARNGKRRNAAYIQQLLDAVTACEPAICRGEEPSFSERKSWDRPLG